MTELHNYDALGLAALIQSKEISTRELLELTIKNAESLNPQLNFLSHRLYDFSEQQIKHGLPHGPFHGVPFLLKNLSGLCEGTLLSDGSRLLKQYQCTSNDEIIQRFKKAGLVFFGRTNAPEFGLSFTTEPLAHGVTHNPWDFSRSPGGSSGGAAAAIAARVIPMAHASDGGGSIRVPASCCGLFGLKPTRARIPAGPIIGEAWGGFATHHVLSLSVRDSAAMLDCLAGPEIGDPYYAPPQPSSYLKALESPVSPLKIGFMDSYGDHVKLDADVKDSFEQTIELLSTLGHTLIPIQFPADIQAMRRSFLIIISGNLLNFTELTQKMLKKKIQPGDIEPMTETFMTYAKSLSAADYAQAVQTVQFHSRKVASLFEKIDMILTPTTAQSARPLGELAGTHQDFNAYNAKQLSFGPFTGLANMTGQPAMSVPLFWNKNNLPIGSHFIAPFGDELTLLQLARQLELAKPWFDKKPNGIFGDAPLRTK